MRIAVVGTGHVGLLTATTLGAIGHHVIGVDDDRGKIDALRAGKPPFFEEGLEELLNEGLSSGVSDHSEAIPGASRLSA